jgi:uncharacterized membrane protein YraQ (UPF0718 family)
MIVEIIRKYRIFLIVILVNVLLFFVMPDMAQKSVTNSFNFLFEVLKILPPVMLLMGLFEVWVPRETIEAHLGAESGFHGSIVAILLGSVAVGPLFTAFPIALSLKHKGVRTSNIVIFLGSWATIKIPMILMESSFIGLRFAIIRLVITIPFILGIGYLMEKILKNQAITQAAVNGP